ncbi:putative uncharacterized protein DDB_G0279653 [Pecten maximus]|uniref:putative uncharacterized protein DDB_G0279653 n=1 Tax=Pecten maximus TaxID=6579 RepID=UPI001458B61E|nr:putative uncharacterized protein DDB_G0279653 [Pecten maximus]
MDHFLQHSDGDDLDKLIKKIEFENQNCVRLIQKESQHIEALEKEFMEGKSMITDLQEKISQVEDDTKQGQRQYTYNRDNCESLKKTLVVLKEHNVALDSQLTALNDSAQQERNGRTEILQHYKAIWEDYQGKYKIFPLALSLEEKQNCVSSLEKQLQEMESQIKHLHIQINEINKSTDDELKDLNKFIVNLAAVKLSTESMSCKIRQTVEARRQIQGQIQQETEAKKEREQQRLTVESAKENFSTSEICMPNSSPEDHIQPNVSQEHVKPLAATESVQSHGSPEHAEPSLSPVSIEPCVSPDHVEPCSDHTRPHLSPEQEQPSMDVEESEEDGSSVLISMFSEKQDDVSNGQDMQTNMKPSLQPTICHPLVVLPQHLSSSKSQTLPNQAHQRLDHLIQRQPQPGQQLSQQVQQRPHQEQVQQRPHQEQQQVQQQPCQEQQQVQQPFQIQNQPQQQVQQQPRQEQQRQQQPFQIQNQPQQQVQQQMFQVQKQPQHEQQQVQQQLQQIQPQQQLAQLQKQQHFQQMQHQQVKQQLSQMVPSITSGLNQISTPKQKPELKTSNYSRNVAPKAPSIHQMSAPKTQNFNTVTAPAALSTSQMSAPKIPSLKPMSSPRAPSINEVSAAKIPNLNQISSLSAPSIKHMPAPRTPNFNQISTNTSSTSQMSAPRPPNLNQISAPRASSINQMSAPRTPNLNQISAPKASSINQMSAPRTSNLNQISAPRASSINQMSAPRTPNLNPMSAPKASNINQMSSPQTPNSDKMLTPRTATNYQAPAEHLSQTSLTQRAPPQSQMILTQKGENVSTSTSSDDAVVYSSQPPETNMGQHCPQTPPSFKKGNDGMDISPFDFEKHQQKLKLLSKSPGPMSYSSRSMFSEKQNDTQDSIGSFLNPFIGEASNFFVEGNTGGFETGQPMTLFGSDKSNNLFGIGGTDSTEKHSSRGGESLMSLFGGGDQTSPNLEGQEQETSFSFNFGTDKGGDTLMSLFGGGVDNSSQNNNTKESSFSMNFGGGSNTSDSPRSFSLF